MKSVIACFVGDEEENEKEKSEENQWIPNESNEWWI